MNLCDDCGFEIPGDAPLGLCPACLIGGAGMEDPLPADDESSELIQGYKLVRQIGEGGFAVVHEAEQLLPVRRRVALKILKPEVSSPQVLARFDAERQALAIMDHPNIASVYDAGHTTHGEPWFAMEYVEGKTLTEFSAEHDLSFEEQLEIFQKTCEAVQHAHLKGVLHRDIKPSNILITEIDGRPAPKVIDFGIARALDVSLTNQTLFTEFHQIVGTPGYMSPEQAALDNTPLDGRSDIYSLGILFYETLTGVQPFSITKSEKPTIPELLRRVREDEPPPLSRFSPEFRGEIEWVITKAIAKDPEERYDSAGSLARELNRILKNRPVEAAPPSKRYLLRKFAQRHQTSVIAGSLVFLSLLAGVTFSTIQFVKATRLGADLQDREIELRREFRNSDYRLGLQMAARRRPGDAIAYFCRSLRTDPNHHASASCLLALLANQKFTKPVYPAMAYREEFESSRFPVIFNDGKSLLTLVSKPEQLARWNMESGICELFSIDSPEPVVSLLANGVEGRFAILTKHSVEVRSIESPDITQSYFEVHSPISSASSAADSDLLIVGCEDGTVSLWDAGKGEEVRRKLLASAPITALANSREGNLIGYGAANGEVGTWGLEFDFQSQNKTTHKSRITVLTLPQSGTHLASGDAAGNAFLWKARQMTEIAGPLYHGDSVSVLQINSSYRRLMTGSADGYARLWDMTDGSFIPPAQFHRSAVVFGAGTSDAGEFITAGKAGSLRIWNVNDGSGETFPDAAQSSAVGMSSSRGYLATMSDNRRRATLHEVDRKPSWVRRLSPGDTNDYTKSFGEIRPLKCTDESQTVTVQLLSRFAITAESKFGAFSMRTVQPIESWAMRKNGSQVVILTEGGKFVVWNPQTGEDLSPSVRLASGNLRGVRFSGLEEEIEFLLNDGAIGRFEIPPAKPTVPEWFLDFAEKIGGKKLAADSSVRSSDDTSMTSIKGILRQGNLLVEHDGEIAMRYATWLTANRDQRTSSPGDTMTTGAYVEMLLKTGNSDRIREALRLDPGNENGIRFLKNKSPVR